MYIYVPVGVYIYMIQTIEVTYLNQPHFALKLFYLSFCDFMALMDFILMTHISVEILVSNWETNDMKTILQYGYPA